jgi:DNA-binding NtrC family response regulator
MANICVIDDKDLVRESLSMTLEREDHTVTALGDPVAALEQLRSSACDLIITDLKMPRMDGLALLRELRAGGCDAPVIVMTAFGTISTAVEAMKLGASDFIQKPFEADALVMQVERALQHGQLRRENEALRTSLADLREDRPMIGGSEMTRKVREQIEKIARSDATVLIAGESGTGKELAAWAVHRASKRGDRPMLCVNCAALSPNLLESELFGHERGAYTGADRARKGRFELADGGTLLLDEISEMALPLQAKLLRVLQEGEFERVGSSQTRRADVRVIATTNRDLGDWVGRKRFRADLYYRLNVLPLELPPLRERRDDVPELMGHFLKRIAEREARPVLTVEPAALKLVCEYAWPGNIRELENICQRAAALVCDGVLRAGTIEAWLSHAALAPVELFGNLRPGRLLEDAERQLIERTLAQCNGHRERTARTLGMGVRTLGMKIKKWREEGAFQDFASAGRGGNGATCSA